MIDPTVQRLLEQAIDTPVKLQLVLLFCENHQFEGTAPQIAQRIFRDIWSTGEALRELSEDGVLGRLPGRDEPVYRYRPMPERQEALRSLLRAFNEPLERDTIQRRLREIASDAPYRRALRGGTAYELIAF